MSVRVDVAPDVLQWAVDRAGWDAATVDRRAPLLAQWLSGQRRPTLKQIQRFASDTHTPLGLLFLPEPPVEQVPIPDLRTMGNVTVPQPSVDLLDTIHQCQLRQDWYRAHALEVGLAGPDFVGAATTDTPPRDVAARLRKLLDVAQAQRKAWDDTLRRLIDRAEQLGVLVMVNGVVGADTHRRLDPREFRGFALADPVAPLVFINGADTKPAQIFTLLHELAHVWLGASALSDADLAVHGHNDERWCNEVAAEALVPLASLQSEYHGPPSTDELERLARHFSVSTLVVLTRLREAELLSRVDYQNRYAAERSRVLSLLPARRPGGNYYHTQPLRLSRRFATAVITSTLEGSTTYRDAYQLLGVRKHATFENLANRLQVA